MTLAIAIIVGLVLIVLISEMAGTINNREIRRKELEQIQQDISQMKDSIEDIREQLADIVLSLSDALYAKMQ